MLVTAEASPSPSHLPSSRHYPWGQFPETGYGPPNQLGTVSGSRGAGKSGNPQVAGVSGVCRPPIQCEGFLCSVVFLTPKGGRVPGENQGSYRGLPSSCSSVCCGPSRAAGAWGSSPAHSRPCLRHPWGLGTCVFGLRPAVLRAPPEGVGRWRVPEGVRVWEQGPGCPAGRRLW